MNTVHIKESLNTVRIKNHWTHSVFRHRWTQSVPPFSLKDIAQEKKNCSHIFTLVNLASNSPSAKMVTQFCRHYLGLNFGWVYTLAGLFGLISFTAFPYGIWCSLYDWNNFSILFSNKIQIQGFKWTHQTLSNKSAVFLIDAL